MATHEEDPLLYGMLMKRRRGGGGSGIDAAMGPSSALVTRAESSFRQHIQEAAQNAWVQGHTDEYLRALERALMAVNQHCTNQAAGC